MLDWTLALKLALVPLLIGLNAFFVAAEYAVVTIRPSRIEELLADGVKRARLLGRLKKDVGDVLAAIQICITATNLLIGAVAEPAISGLIAWALSPLGFVLPISIARPIGLAVGLIIVTFFTVVLSELLPKALTLQHTDRIALRVARPIHAVRRVCAPLVRLMNWTADRITRSAGLGELKIEEPVHSETELEILVDKADDAGEFHEVHGEMLRKAFDFADLTVRHVMIPLRDAEVLDSNMLVDDLAARLHRRPYTRWPIRDPRSGRITGIVNVKMALFALALSAGEAVILHDLAVPPMVVDPDMPLVDALHAMRRHKQHIAIVVDRDGREQGIVTLQDMLGSIVGSMPPEGVKG